MLYNITFLDILKKNKKNYLKIWININIYDKIIKNSIVMWEDIYMLSNNTKFNLLLGDNFNKLVSLPTKQVIMRSILSVIDRDFIVSSNNSSLAELVQKLLDKVLNEKQEIVDIISDLFSMENKSDLSFYKEIFDSDMFSSIIKSEKLPTGQLFSFLL